MCPLLRAESTVHVLQGKDESRRPAPGARWPDACHSASKQEGGMTCSCLRARGCCPLAPVGHCLVIELRPLPRQRASLGPVYR